MKLTFFSIIFSVALVCSLVGCGDKSEPVVTNAAGGAMKGPVRTLKDLGEAKAALKTWQRAAATRVVLENSLKANPTWADLLLDAELTGEVGFNLTPGNRGLYAPLHPYLSKSAIERHLEVVSCAVSYGETNGQNFTELDILLAKHPNLNGAVTEEYHFPLFSVQTQESLRRLIDAKIDVNRQLGGKTLLTLATASNNLPLMQMLKDHGALE